MVCRRLSTAFDARRVHCAVRNTYAMLEPLFTMPDSSNLLSGQVTEVRLKVRKVDIVARLG